MRTDRKTGRPGAATPSRDAEVTQGHARVGLHRRVWRRLPAMLRAVLLGMLILNLGQLPAFAALWINLQAAPQLPLFLPIGVLWLALFWRYLDGAWWPASTSDSRRRLLRSASLPGASWLPALIAGGFGMLAVLGLALLTGQLADLPDAARAAPFDLSPFPWWTLLAFFLLLACTAGVVEEAAFRGVMLSIVERRHGWVVAIAFTTLIFWFAHLSHAYATLAFAPFFLAYSALHGALVYATRSIRPSVLLHIAGDLSILPIQYGVLPLPLGAGALPYAIVVALASSVSVLGFVALWRVRQRDDGASLPGSTGNSRVNTV
jgi:membrane protease YdiL (CAAX protease family)